MFIELNKCKIYYEVHGKEGGEPIFFIHGGPGLGDCRGDIASFSELGDTYQLVFLDMRGSGRSEEKPPYTHEQWTDDIEALREYLNLDKIHILGGSYGGYLTLEYVIRYPERVEKVVLRDTAPSNNYNDLSRERALNSDLPGVNEEMIHRLFEGNVGSNEEFKEMYKSILPLYTVEYNEKVGQDKIDSMYFHYETHNYAFSQNKNTYDVTERLREIESPVLVTVGRHDWVTPVVCSEDIHKGLKNSKFVIFENSGHSPQVEENQDYLALMRNFLNN